MHACRVLSYLAKITLMDKSQEEIATITAECIDKGDLSKIKDAISTEFLVGIDEDYSGTTEVPSSRKQKVSKDVQANKGVLGKILEGRYEIGSDSDTVFDRPSLPRQQYCLPAADTRDGWYPELCIFCDSGSGE